MTFNKLILVCCVTLFSSICLSSDWQSHQNKQLTIAKITTNPVIDGYLGKEEWKEARVVSDFVEFRPNLGGKSDYPVTAYIGYDANYFYVAARIKQPEDMITDRVLTQGSKVWDEDYFGIVLDTNLDRNDAYLFHVTPSGVKEDGLVIKSKYLGQWNALWYAKTQRTANGWSVEIAIPMQSISFDPEKSAWGLQIRHKISNPYKQMFWNLNNRQNSAWNAQQVGVVKGMSGLKQGKGIEIRPSLSVKHDDYKDEINIAPALDAFYKVTPNLTASLTINTDFTGTDIDDQDVNLTRFSSYFKERRDFFLEDMQVFQFGGLGDHDTNGLPFYSRRMGLSTQGTPLDIKWGAKLGGQIGDTQIGLLSVNQDSDSLDNDDTTQLSVVRAKYLINENHSLGGLLTHGTVQDIGDNILYGFDYQYESIVLSDQSLQINAWYQNAQNDNQPGSIDSKAYGAQLLMPNDRFYLRAKYRYLGDDFDPALGFVNRTGIQYYEALSHLRWRPESEWLSYYQIVTGYYQTDDTNGRLQSKKYLFKPIVLNTNQSESFELIYINREEVLTTALDFSEHIIFSAGTHRFSTYGGSFKSDTSRDFYTTIDFEKGKYYSSDYKSISTEFSYQPSKHLRLNLDRSLYFYKQGENNYSVHSSSFNMDVAFNTEWSWNLKLQHNTLHEHLSVFSRLRYQSAPDELYQATFSQGYLLENGWRHRERQINETAFKVNYILRW